MVRLEYWGENIYLRLASGPSEDRREIRYSNPLITFGSEGSSSLLNDTHRSYPISLGALLYRVAFTLEERWQNDTLFNDNLLVYPTIYDSISCDESYRIFAKENQSLETDEYVGKARSNLKKLEPDL